MIYGYASVYNVKGVNKVNILSEQVLQLFNNGCSKVVEEVVINMEDRPRFNELLEELQEDDTLMVTKLESISRSLSEGRKLIIKLIQKNVEINILNIGIIYKDIYSAFAEYERSMITNQIPKDKVVVLRKHLYNEEIINNALALLNINGGNYSYNQAAFKTGISRSTLLREQKKRREMEFNQLKND